jgi:hypothetical protein
MKYPIITAFAPLSNLTIKVYDFHIIMYFYLEQKYAKQTQFYAIIARKRRFYEKTKPIQTQSKPIQSQFNPKQSQFKPNLSKGEKMKPFAWNLNSTIVFVISSRNLSSLRMLEYLSICMAVGQFLGFIVIILMIFFCRPEFFSLRNLGLIRCVSHQRLQVPLLLPLTGPAPNQRKIIYDNKNCST